MCQDTIGAWYRLITNVCKTNLTEGLNYMLKYLLNVFYVERENSITSIPFKEMIGNKNILLARSNQQGQFDIK